MPNSAEFVQRVVHRMEDRSVAVWTKRSLMIVVIAGLALFYLLHEFRGLAAPQGMDQAQIGREIASGHGWRTNFIRPRALGLLIRHGKDVQKNIWYDTYNAPLPPLVNAIALFPFKSHRMSPQDSIYIGDRVIAATAILFFLASLLLLFLIARRLFDERLAVLSCGLVLVCDTIWQYSLSGLPQMLMLFLLNATVYAMVRALGAQYRGGRVGVWLAAAGVGFGLLALSHALTIWMTIPALIFCAFVFRPRGWAALVVLVPFVLIYALWLIRNYLVCGQPGGLALYSVLDSIQHSEGGWMRRINPDLSEITLALFRDKTANNLVTQLGSIFQYFGWSVVAPIFFVSTLHSFKRTETAMLRWMILAMWGGAVFGMALYGIREEQGVAANQLHLLFIPLMTCYGLAFLLVQWHRLQIDLRIARIGFLTLVFVLSGLPLLFVLLLPNTKSPIQWPPYVPPYISVLNDWMRPDEIIASDMPWAVAWYANRRSLLVPETIATFTELNDYKILGAPVNGLYLTPISGSQNTLSDVLTGEYRDWAPAILRSVDFQKFPLKWATLLGLENECIFFSDHDRLKMPAH